MYITASARSWFKLSTNYHFGKTDFLLCSSAGRIHVGKRNILYLNLLMCWMVTDYFLNWRDHNSHFDFFFKLSLFTSVKVAGKENYSSFIELGFILIKYVSFVLNKKICKTTFSIHHWEMIKLWCILLVKYCLKDWGGFKGTEKESCTIIK